MVFSTNPVMVLWLNMAHDYTGTELQQSGGNLYLPHITRGFYQYKPLFNSSCLIGYVHIIEQPHKFVPFFSRCRCN